VCLYICICVCPAWSAVAAITWWSAVSVSSLVRSPLSSHFTTGEPRHNTVSLSLSVCRLLVTMLLCWVWGQQAATHEPTIAVCACRENRARGGGICVANHTSPIDVTVLGYDNCYALVRMFNSPWEDVWSEFVMENIVRRLHSSSGTIHFSATERFLILGNQALQPFICHICSSTLTERMSSIYCVAACWRYDTIEDFKVDSKAECDWLNLAHSSQ